MRTASKTQPHPTSLRKRAERRVKAEIQDLLQINGNSYTARDWVPRVVMMTYDRRCAGNPADPELAACYAVARDLAGGDLRP